MPTFVEEIQSIAEGDVHGLEARIAERVETVGDAVTVLEEWTEASSETHAELSSQYDAAKSLARDEVRDAGADPEDLAAEDLLTHDAVSDQTKRRLSEYSTKLYVFLDEERSYEGAREELLDALGDELSLYQRLLDDLGAGGVSVRDAQREIARFAREGSLGSPTRTATDVLLESTVEE